MTMMTQRPDELSGGASSGRTAWGRPWPWAGLCALLLLAGLADRLPGSILPARGLGLWRGLSKAELDLRVHEFVSGIPVPKEDMRLVVGVLDLEKHLMAESRKKALGVDLGTTKVSVSVPARVHYAIDLSGRLPVEFRVDPRRQTFTAVFPAPQVQAVEVFSQGKRTYVETGWARFKALSGRALEDALEADLYDAIREEASAPAAVDSVKVRARPVLARFLAEYLRKAGAWEGTRGFRLIRIQFRGDDLWEEAPSRG